MEVALVWIVFAVIVGAAANARGRNGLGWFLLAAIISPLLAALALLLFPNLRPVRVADHTLVNERELQRNIDRNKRL